VDWAGWRAKALSAYLGEMEGAQKGGGKEKIRLRGLTIQKRGVPALGRRQGYHGRKLQRVGGQKEENSPEKGRFRKSKSDHSKVRRFVKRSPKGQVRARSKRFSVRKRANRAFEHKTPVILGREGCPRERGENRGAQK